MNDIFKEVEDDIHNERLAELWKKYGSAVITFAVGIIIGTAVYVVLDAYKTKQYEAETGKLITLTQEATKEIPDVKSADALAAYGTEIGGDKGALALLKSAETYRELGENDKAVKTYDAVAAMKSVDMFYNDLGVLMAVQMQLDKMSAADVEKKLSPLTGADRPLRFTASEMLAYVAMSKGDYKAAQAKFKELAADTSAPQSLQQRAAALANIAPAAGDDKKEAGKSE